jgi:cytochrome P450
MSQGLQDITDWRRYPHVVHATVITSFDEAEEVLVSDAFAAGSFETESAPFKRSTVFEVNGVQHQIHRRLAAPLFARRALSVYEHELLEPAIDRCLDECREARGADGVVRADLVTLARRILVQIAATVIGLDDCERPERMTTLLAYADALGAAADVKWSHRDHRQVVREGLVARDGFVRDFYGPSRARRRDLVARERERRLDRLPNDLITMMLVDSSVEWDEELCVREAIVYLTAGIRTTAHAITRTFEELERWSTRHPEDDGRTETEFLRNACNETLRLHPPSPAIVREAAIDLTLRSGRSFVAGDRVAIDLCQANRDPRVFGGDADAFNPNRTTVGRAPLYGLSFGAGPHVCIGKPLVTSTKAISSGERGEIQRTVVRVLRRLLSHGIRSDPERAPVRAPTEQDRYESFPMILAGL